MNTSRELLDMVATEAVEKYQRAEAVASSASVVLWVCRNCGWRDNYERLMTSGSGLKTVCPSCGGWADPCKHNDVYVDKK